jgi:hypothetical protein
MAAIRRDSMQPGSAEFCLSNSAVLPLEKPQSCKSGKLCGTLRHEPFAPPVTAGSRLATESGPYPASIQTTART